MKRNKSVHGDGKSAITPTFFPQSELSTLQAENATLRQRLQAQSHAVKELNKTLHFLVKTFGQPLTPREETRPRHQRRIR